MAESRSQQSAKLDWANFHHDPAVPPPNWRAGSRADDDHEAWLFRENATLCTERKKLPGLIHNRQQLKASRNICLAAALGGSVYLGFNDMGDGFRGVDWAQIKTIAIDAAMSYGIAQIFNPFVRRVDERIAGLANLFNYPRPLEVDIETNLTWCHGIYELQPVRNAIRFMGDLLDLSNNTMSARQKSLPPLLLLG